MKVILENQLYEGRLIWNRRAWKKHPDTGKRINQRRPREEWIITEDESLRIVPAEVIEQVRARQQKNREAGRGVGRAPAQRYLFSGLLACGECGGSFTIVANHRYGCAAYKTRGTTVCGNSSTVSRHIVERRLLASIKDRLGAPGSLEKFTREAAMLIESHNASDRSTQLATQLHDAEHVRDNLLAALKQGIITTGTKGALQEAEAQVADVSAQLEHAKRWRVAGILPRAVDRYRLAVNHLEETLASHVESARELLRLLIGDRILIHRRGRYLEAELPNRVHAVLAQCIGQSFDLGGCGGPQRHESTFVCLRPSRSDATPLRHRQRHQPDDGDAYIIIKKM